MSEFNVISIIDANTIKVSPSWKWREKTGNLVKINLSIDNTSIPEIEVFKSRLKDLLQDKFIELKNPTHIDEPEEKIYCYVFLNGVNISKYFPDIKIPA
jgi:hypothetical protein